MNNYSALVSIFGLLILGSCVKYEKLINYQADPTIESLSKEIRNYQPIVLHPNDLLEVSISANDALAIAPFNLNNGSLDTEEDSNQRTANGNYLMDRNGQINFPILGLIQLDGLTTEQASKQLLDKIAPYFKESPIVNVRLMNFKVSVSGEVARPGSFSVSGERITVLEAIIMAGDFNNFSMRDSVLVIREQNNERTFGYVNFNSAEVFSSPYFYLKQNDVIYVKPEKSKLGSIRNPSTNVLPWVSAVTSILILVISLTRS